MHSWFPYKKSVFKMFLPTTIMDEGEYVDGRILQADSVVDMLTPRYRDEQAIFWLQGVQRWNMSVHQLIGHIGNDYGVSTVMFFEPGTDRGVIVLANLQERSRQAGTMKIMLTLFEYSEMWR